MAAVLFDLDDTLFPQADWLAGAWRAVARAAARGNPDARAAAIEAALVAVAAEGSDRGRIIDRALERAGGHAEADALAPLVEVFRSYRPDRIDPYPGVPEALERLRRIVPLALVTDGDVGLQEAKLDLLGLNQAFDVVVLSDALGRELRKPSPAPFRVALDRLRVAATDAVFVGDRPDKDIAGATAAGMRTIRVRSGEYAEVDDVIAPWRTTATAVEAIEGLLEA